MSRSNRPSWAVEPSGRTSGVAGRAAMGLGDAPQLGVAGLVGRVEDDRHVHHDVDEQRFRADERAQVLPALLNRMASVRPAWISTWRRRSSGQLVPGPIGIEKDEAQVVHVAVVLAMFEQAAVVFGPVRHAGIVCPRRTNCHIMPAKNPPVQSVQSSPS